MRSFLSLAIPAVILLFAVALGAFLCTVGVREIAVCAAAKAYYQEHGKPPSSLADLPSVEHLAQHPDGYRYQVVCEAKQPATCTVSWTEMDGVERIPGSRSCGALDGWGVDDFY